MNNAYIHPIKLESHFTVIANELIRDPWVSWEAKSLLQYLLSLPSNWKLSTKHLAGVYRGPKKGGKIDAIRSMIKELRE